MGGLQVLLTRRPLTAGQHSLCSEDIEKLIYKDEKHLPVTHQAAVRGRKTSNPPKSHNQEGWQNISAHSLETFNFNKLGPKNIASQMGFFSTVFSDFLTEAQKLFTRLCQTKNPSSPESFFRRLTEVHATILKILNHAKYSLTLCHFQHYFSEASCSRNFWLCYVVKQSLMIYS